MVAPAGSCIRTRRALPVSAVVHVLGCAEAQSGRGVQHGQYVLTGLEQGEEVWLWYPCY